MSEEQKSKSGCGWMHVIVLAVSGMLIALMFPPCIGGIYDKSFQATTSGNCRQVLAALTLYVGDHDGAYQDAHEPNPTTANQAFRILIRESVLDDERVFGGMCVRFLPDNNIGEPPEYAEALQPGENHWAMTKGATDRIPQKTPLVFENPATATWPPTWNVDAARTRTRGRAWSGGKIIVGFNDGAVELINLQSGRGKQVPPVRDSGGKDVFTRAAPSMQVLDVEE